MNIKVNCYYRNGLPATVIIKGAYRVELGGQGDIYIDFDNKEQAEMLQEEVMCKIYFESWGCTMFIRRNEHTGFKVT